MIRRSSYNLIALAFAVTLAVAPRVSAQTAQPPASEAASIAVESDILSFFISGYSGIVNLSLGNGFQTAFGVGRYDVPSFLVEGDANFDAAQWTATVPSVQVFRATYRFRGPMKNGPALGLVVLNQNWRLRSAPLGGETKFRTLSLGPTGGYYIHVGKHFYVYPTAAYTYNKAFGETSIRGVNYHVERFAPNASLHVGWEWGL
jgi:hypothetical protein